MCVYHSVPSQSSAAAAKSLQSRPTLCNPIDGSPPGSSVPEFSRQEHWSGMPFPSPMHACMLSHFSRVRLCATPWRAAPRLLCPQDSLGEHTGVGCHFLLLFLLTMFKCWEFHISFWVRREGKKGRWVIEATPKSKHV